MWFTGLLCVPYSKIEIESHNRIGRIRGVINSERKYTDVAVIEQVKCIFMSNTYFVCVCVSVHAQSGWAVT